MSRFSGVEAFVHVAEERSFRAAARKLGLSPAAMSKAVSGLEQELGVRLLNRTTRHVSPTPEGALYLPHAREALDRLQVGRDLVTHAAQVVEGRLRVSLSVALGRALVARLDRFVQACPRVQVELSFRDDLVDLAAEEVDVVVRIGAPPDSRLVGRRLRAPRWATVAAPAYLARHGEPRHPGELQHHACLHFLRPTGVAQPWAFQQDGTALQVLGESPVRLDHGDLLVDAARAGVGLVQVFDFMVEADLARGDLVEVLRPWAAPGPVLHALCLPGRQKVPRIRAFLEFVVEVFG